MIYIAHSYHTNLPTIELIIIAWSIARKQKRQVFAEIAVDISSLKYRAGGVLWENVSLSEKAW